MFFNLHAALMLCENVNWFGINVTPANDDDNNDNDDHNDDEDDNDNDDDT